MAATQPKTLYLDTGNAVVRIDGDAIRVERPEKASEFVPLRRVARAVVRDTDDSLLQVCLEIVRRGGTVHFQAGDGHIAAVLQNARPSAGTPMQELSSMISGHDGLGPFNWWRDAQLRHAWSLVFRHGYSGDFVGNRRRLLAYLARLAPTLPINDESHRLGEDLYAWLQAELNRQGWHPIAGALGGKGGDLINALWDCLSLPLTWSYVRWRRDQPEVVHDVEIRRFFELRTVASLPEQLNRHLRALANEYSVSWSVLHRREHEEAGYE